MSLATSANPAVDAEQVVRLYAAGSLRAVLTDIIAACDVAVDTTFAPSGLLRQRIESGERAAVFASADMRHPRALADAGIGGPAVMFARNELCALARSSVEVCSDTLLDVLLDPDIRVGAATPGADPAGDYAWALFDRTDAIRAGAADVLKNKARMLTGGPDSPPPPSDRNNYAWVMDAGHADLFLTYWTNARAAQAEVDTLQVVALPAALAVGADYGLSLLAAASPAAVRLVLFILSPSGQRILGDHGFGAPLLSAD